MSANGRSGHRGLSCTEDDRRTQFQTSIAAGRQAGAWTWASTGMIARCISSSVRGRGRTEGDNRGRGRRMVESWTREVEERT
jgi:hypothetical protein